MIRYIYADELHNYPKLRTTMFKDRADQFSERLNWDVTVDVDGLEIDEYDALNPLYVIWEQPDGTHGGSMRFLPTVGRTMVNEHFLALTDGVQITSPLIWECTRFCVSQSVANSGKVSTLLMMAGALLGLSFHLQHAVGVFDTRMIRIYGRLGWAPDVLGTLGTGADAISVGLWAFSEARFSQLAAAAGISDGLARHWLARGFSFTPDHADCA